MAARVVGLALLLGAACRTPAEVMVPGPAAASPAAAPKYPPGGRHDTDNDGFADLPDECPTLPGIAPHGCPADDIDGDGVKNASDRCPSRIETVNHFMDADGCPDEVPRDLVEGLEYAEYSPEDGAALIDQGPISAALRAVVDRVAKALRAYPDVCIMVSMVGLEDEMRYGQDLVARRVRALVALLVRDGKIAGDRLREWSYADGYRGIGFVLIDCDRR